MNTKKWLIYGATGYTGKLIAEFAKEKGLEPVLAGRNKGKLQELADKYGFSYKAFSLDSVGEIETHIREFDLVLHCAGPFIETADPMSEACIRTGTHYLDITGEIPVYELLHAKSERASSQKVVLIPGVGFDIVPTDCVASMIKTQLPSATELDLGFWGLGGVSAGTAKSALAQAPYGSKIRRDGKITQIPQFSLQKEFQMDGKKKTLYSIPWGDVYTAHVSTGIPNITVYTFVPQDAVKISKLMTLGMPLLKNDWVLKMAQSAVDLFIEGPDEDTRKTGKTIVVGEGRNPEGKSVRVEIQTCEGYKFTALSALEAVSKILFPTEKGESWKKSGFLTPSLAFGEKFVFEIPGTKAQN